MTNQDNPFKRKAMKPKSKKQKKPRPLTVNLHHFKVTHYKMLYPLIINSEAKFAMFSLKEMKQVVSFISRAITYAEQTKGK